MQTNPPLLGYVDRLSARPGDTLQFKISSDAAEPFRTRLVRIVCADPNPEGPGTIEHEVESDLEASYPSRVQHFYPGSYLNIPIAEPLPLPATFSLSAIVWPTLPQAGQQCIASLAGPAGEPLLSLSVGDDARLHACTGTDNVIRGDAPLQGRNWYQVFVCVDRARSELVLGQKDLDDPNAVAKTWRISLASISATWELAQVRFAAENTHTASNHFNGKIEAPMLLHGAFDTDALGQGSAETRPLAAWDFSIDIPSTRIHDCGPHGLHGALVNLPARAMTGSNWDGSEMCWRHGPAQYAAIHFHDDDIVDFEWDTDFSYTIPESLSSGVYAVRLTCGEHSDAIPFFVCAPRDKPKAALCVLVSTFTYAVYGNHARPDFTPAWKDKMAAWDAYPWNSAEHREYGLSTYNFHRDGSGICHASHRRPLFTLRPGYLTFCNEAGEGSGLRHFQADSHLLAWLESKDIAYDIITDQELHDEGVEAISGYRALTTGSHPEYHTRETLDALTQYRDGGGNLLYLGGNGFYWKVALHTEHEGAIEIRRGESGIRAWAAEPGEYYNAFDGSYGGVWRRNGRAPQKLAGIGFSAQGTFLGSYYRKAPAASDPAHAWIFEGISDEILGDFGLCGGGAAGFELDRVESRLGTPSSTVVLASSEGHGDTFVMVPEEHLTHITTWSGADASEVIRADMIYAELPGGGKLFSTGSITFCGALPHNNFDNNVSRLLENVVRNFCA